MACRIPACPECGSESRPVQLKTKPLVFECEGCSSLFTRTARGVPVADLRAIRRQIVQRWDQLADDVHALVREIRNAPEGTFTQTERDDAAFELDNTVWDVMVNHRPRLASSARRKVSKEFRRELARLRLIREFVESGEYERILSEERAAIVAARDAETKS